MSGVRGLFWNAGERRLRAPWRLVVTLSVALLAAALLAPAATALAGADGAGSGAALGVAVAGAAFLLVAWVVVGVSWVVDRRPPRDLGMGLGRRWWADCAAGVGVGLAMAGVAVAALLAAGGSVGGPVQGREAQLVVPGVEPVAATALWVVFFLGAATLEEVFVRGYLLVNAAEGLAGRLGGRRAVLAALAGTALLFGLLHAANPGGTLLGLANITLAGLLLGWSVVATGRLGLAVGVHTAWNVALGPVFGLPVSGLLTGSALAAVEPAGPGPVTGGRFGPEGGLVGTAGLLVGVGLLALWLGRRGERTLRVGLSSPELRGPGAGGGGAGAEDGEDSQETEPEPEPEPS